MWGFIQKGKELGSKAKDFVQQIGVQEIEQVQPQAQQQNQMKPQINQVKQFNLNTSTPDKGVKQQIQQKEKILIELIEKLKVVQKEQFGFVEAIIFGQETEKRVSKLVSQIVKENQKKFIDKAKITLLSKIEQRLENMVQEYLSDDIPSESKISIKDAFLIDFDERDLFQLDEQVNYSSIINMFVQEIEVITQRKVCQQLGEVQEVMKKSIDECSSYVENERKNLLNSVFTLEGEKQRLEDALILKASESAKYMEESEEWQKRFQNIKKIQSETEQILAESNIRIQNMESVMISKSEQIASISDQNYQLIEQINHIKAQNQQYLNGSQVAMNEELEKSQKEMEAYQNQLLASKEAILKAQSQIAQVLQEKMIDADVKRQINQQKEKVEEQLQQTQEILKNKEEEIEKYKNLASQFQIELKQGEEQKEQIKNHEKLINSLQEQIQSNQKDIQSQQDHKENQELIMQELIQLKNEKLFQEKENNQLQNQNNYLKQQISQLEENNLSIHQQIKLLEENILLETQAKQQITYELQKQENFNFQIKKDSNQQIEDLSKEIIQLKKQLQESEQSLLKTITILDEEKEKRYQHEQQLKQCNDSLQDTYSHLSKCNEEIFTLKSIFKIEQDNSQNLSEKIKLFEEELAREKQKSQDELTIQKNHESSVKEEHQKEREAIQEIQREELIRLQETLKAQGGEGISNEISKLSEEKTRLSNEIFDLKNLLRDSEDELLKWKNETHSLSSKNKEVLEQIITIKGETKLKIELLEQKIDHLLNENNLKSQIEEKLTNKSVLIENELKSVQNQLNASLEQINLREDEISAKNQIIINSNQSLDKINAELASTKEQHQQMQEQFNSIQLKCSEISSEIQQKNKDIQNLQSQSQQKQNEIEQLSEIINQLKESQYQNQIELNHQRELQKESINNVQKLQEQSNFQKEELEKLKESSQYVLDLQNDNQILKNQLEELKIEKSNQELLLNEKVKLNIILSNSQASQQADIITLQKSLSDQKESYLIFKSMNQELKEENQKIQITLEQSQLFFKQEQQQKKIAEEEKLKIQSACDQLDKNLQQKESELKQLEYQLIRTQQLSAEEESLNEKKRQEEINSLIKQADKASKYVEALKRGNKELIGIMSEAFLSLAGELDKLDISKQVNTLQDLVKASSPEIMKEISKFISESKSAIVSHYYSQISNAKNSEKAKFNKLSEQFTKQSDEMKILSSRAKAVEKLEKQLLELSEVISLQKQTIKNKETALNEIQIELVSGDAEKRAEIALVNDKFYQLKGKYDSLINEGGSLKEQNNDLISNIQELEKNKIGLEEKVEQITEELSILREKESYLSILEGNLASLQTVHEEFLKRSENSAKKYDSEIKRMRTELASLKEKVSQIDELKSQILQSELAINEKNQKIILLQEHLSESERQTESIKTETNTLLNKLKHETIKSEFQIDRRVITNFLIQYFDTNSSNQVKLQILDTMASVLAFSEEEKIKIGLQKQRLGFFSSNQNSSDQQGQKSLTNKFISFLLSNDEEEKK